jgi:hypothetical protein
MRTCSGEGQHRQRLSVVGMGWIVVGLRPGGTRDVALDGGLSGMGQWWGNRPLWPSAMPCGASGLIRRAAEPD